MKIIFFLLLLFMTSLAHALTLEEKVGQTLMVHFNGEIANADAEKLIDECHVGGFIYYKWANGLHDPAQVKQLSDSLQMLADIPLLIAIDQEGGRVSRLSDGFKKLPSQCDVAMRGDLKQAQEDAEAMGKELKAVGINMNLAPVVDIALSPHSVIGNRSFGRDEKCVTEFASAYLLGYHAANIITSLKHFPGYGSVNVDAHDALPVLERTKEQMLAEELRPYAKLAKVADTIMTAHLMLPSLDPDNSATFSSLILQGLLRGELGFQGVIISDSLIMKGALKNNPSLTECAIQAFNAGCDLLLLGGKQLNDRQEREIGPEEVQEIHKALCEAVKSGRICEKRLDDAVERILKLKASMLF